MVCMTVRSVSCVRCISCGDFRERPRRQVSKTEGRGALIASGITPSAKAGPRSVEVCAHASQGQPSLLQVLCLAPYSLAC